MSLPEDYFGSSSPFDDMEAMAFASDTDLLATFWAEEKAMYEGLFVRVRSQFDQIRECYTVGDKTNWQSFHVIPDTEGATRLWVVHQESIGQSDHATRIIWSREDRDKLRYSEYALSGKYPQSGSVHAEADNDPTAEAWTIEAIGEAALIQLVGSEVRLFRGEKNRKPMPTNCDRSYEEAAVRLDARELIQKELIEMSDLLNKLGVGTYEQGAEGDFK